MDLGEGPLEHLLRTLPPWNTGPQMTECGRPVSDVQAVVSRAEVEAKIARVGKQRAAFSTCMTCAQTSDRYRHDTGGKLSAVERWAQGAWRQKYDPTENGNRQQRELMAVEMLLAEYREEFESYVAALEQTTDLAAARRRARIRRVP